MELVRVCKDGSCEPTLKGNILEVACKPLWFLAKYFPKIYGTIYKKLLNNSPKFQNIIFISLWKQNVKSAAQIRS